MPLKIRLARGGTKKRPYYRIVVADSRSPRDGRFIEKVGSYNPLLAKDDDTRITLEEERIKHWLSVGARPTDRVNRFLDTAGIMPREAAIIPKRDCQAKSAWNGKRKNGKLPKMPSPLPKALRAMPQKTQRQPSRTTQPASVVPVCLTGHMGTTGCRLFR